VTEPVPRHITLFGIFRVNDDWTLPPSLAHFSLLRKAVCENFLRDEGGEQKEGMDFLRRREVWRGKEDRVGRGEDMRGHGRWRYQR
jgi:hypothetical protein